MSKRILSVATATAAIASAAFPAAGSAGHAGFDHYRSHSKTVTASCSGGTGFTVDANAYFGQLTETAAWNAGEHGTTCGVTAPE